MIDSGLIVNRIKLICKEQNIQMSELEDEIGLSKGNISRWRKSLPSTIVSIIKISQILNVSLDYILGLNFEESRGEVVNSISQILIQKTKNKELNWYKISYEKAKKIPKISDKNKFQYQNYCETYEAQYNNHNIIFSYYNQPIADVIDYNLWLYKDGDYIDISFTKIEIEQIKNLIINKKSQAISELLIDLNKED